MNVSEWLRLKWKSKVHCAIFIGAPEPALKRNLLSSGDVPFIYNSAFGNATDNGGRIMSTGEMKTWALQRSSKPP